MSLGERIQRVMDEKGITPSELCRKTGWVVSTSTLSNLIKRKSTSSKFTQVIADALGVPIADLLGDAVSDEPNLFAAFVEEHDIAFSGGNGRNGQPESAVKALRAYDPDWLQQEGLKPDKLRRFTVEGDSMEPLLFDGDAILVNMSETNVIDGKVYAFRYGDDLKVKRLIKQLDGSLVLKSQNEDYRDEIISADQVEQKVQIIGRVRDKSGKGGL